MAKLKSHGEEVARLEKHFPATEDDVEWVKTVKAVFKKKIKKGFTISVLKKDQIRFKATTYSKARNHDWGWRVSFKSNVSEDNVNETIKKLITSNLDRGWSKVK